MAEMMSGMDMPTEQRSDMILYFSPEASLYEKAKQNEDDHAGGGGMGGNFHAAQGMQIRMMTSTPNNKVFIDLEKNEILEQKEFMTRTFLIKGDMPENDWKITGKQKMILDYPCMEAVKTDTAGAVTRVWFTPGVPCKSGPLTFCNLPGLVLEVDVEDGSRRYIAKSISLETPDKEYFKKPKDGKKVTKEEFDKIVEEKRKEMGLEQGGEGNNVMIRIRY
jgi:GLPGLI family protein